MFVHAVYFWLRPDLTHDERARFASNLQGLASIPSQGCYIGTPASTDRPVIDRTYTWALVLLFKDLSMTRIRCTPRIRPSWRKTNRCGVAYRSTIRSDELFPFLRKR